GAGQYWRAATLFLSSSFARNSHPNRSVQRRPVLTHCEAVLTARAELRIPSDIDHPAPPGISRCEHCLFCIDPDRATMSPRFLEASCMIGSFTFESLPCRVIFGSSTLGAAADEVKRLDGKRALILTTPQQEAEGRRLGVSLGPLFAGIFAGATMHTPVE